MAWPKKQKTSIIPKPSRKHWRKMSVHPALHQHIMGSQLLSPMAMMDNEQNEGEGGSGDNDEAGETLGGLGGIGM